MIDHKRFREERADAFFLKAKEAARKTAALRKGNDLAADDLKNGYINGNQARETRIMLEYDRQQAQQRFRPLAEQFKADTASMVEGAFAMDARTMSEVAPIFSLLGTDAESYKSLAKQYSGNYTALRLLANEAEKNGVYFGTLLGSALDDYKKACEKFLPGLADKATAGVLGHNSYWEEGYEINMLTCEKARQGVAVVTGEVVLVDGHMAQLKAAMDDAVWSQ